jgi:hypothetical protein
MLLAFIFLFFFVEISSSFPKDISQNSFARKFIDQTVPRSALALAAANWFRPTASADSRPIGRYGDTNEVVRIVNNVKHRRLGNSDIYVSELGLGTQRW